MLRSATGNDVGAILQVERATAAERLARRVGNAGLARGIRERATLYSNARPYRVPPGSAENEAIVQADLREDS